MNFRELFSKKGRMLSPFEFLGRHPAGGSLAIIGNGPDVVQFKHGSHIDKFQTVVRFNACATAGFEKQIGSFTDILCVNHNIGTSAPAKISRSTRNKTYPTLLVINNSFNPEVNEDLFWKAVYPADVFFTFGPSLGGVPDTDHTKGLTTGTQCIHLLAKFMRPSKLFISGFTLFLDPKKDHYWEDRAEAHGEREQRNHDFQRERIIFCNILNHHPVKTFITEDVLRVFEATSIQPGAHINLYKKDKA